MIREKRASRSSVATMKPPVAKKPVAAAPSATIQLALEEFFDHLSDEEAAPANDKRRRTKGDGRADAIVDGAIRLLIRKEPLRQAELDDALARGFAKLPGALKAEVVLVYLAQQRGKVALLDKGAKLILPFAFSGTATLPQYVGKVFDPNAGWIGKSLAHKGAIVSHDARTAPPIKHEMQALGIEARTIVTLPLADGDAVFGAIQVVNKDRASGEEFFSTQDQRILEAVGRVHARLIRRFLTPKLAPNEDEIARYVAHLARTEAIDLTRVAWDDALWEEIGYDAIQKYQVLPLQALEGKAVSVVISNPLDAARRRYFELAADRTVGEALAATPSQIRAVLEARTKGRKANAETDAIVTRVVSAVGDRVVETVAAKLEKDVSDTPIIQLVNHLIEDAAARGASDIHIEPAESDLRVRYRVDGNLSERLRLPRQAHEPVIARLKIMAPPMKIDEKRLPQDGKIKFKDYSVKGLDLDLRVATSPSSHGEKCVLRLLAKQSIHFGLEAMGYSPENLEAVRWATRQPHGMVLCCGPTGSGKTTTLYAAMTEVNQPDVNIVTAEDPIEYPLAGITQTQVDPKIGLTFARALRSFLRMDPDVILVGEIRDRKTARTAIEAALTGHLLLSTLHTNDAASTVTRFVEMKVEPFLISSSLLLVSAQRLARRLCIHCRVPLAPTPQMEELLAADPHPSSGTIYKAREKGCERCGGSGYKGRVGIHEILTLQGELGAAVRELVHKKVGSEVLKARAVELGMRTMWQDALWKVKEGITDLREVGSIIKADSGKKPRAVRRGRAS